jgi:hypothetical protein
MSSRTGRLLSPPVWDEPRLEGDRQQAIAAFRDERMREPLEKYLEVFEVYRDVFDELLATSVDLTRLSDNAVAMLSDKKFLEAVRYLSGPPISFDDLKVLADASSVAPKTLRANPDLAQRLVETIMTGLDRQRFPWIAEQREATDHERTTAVIASGAMIAAKRVETERRNEGKTAQEQRVRSVLLEDGFSEVPPRAAQTLAEAPRPGQFCMEAMLGTRKADLLVGLWDHRIMPIECKVSNSATNSIKRLNNDAAVKAETWRRDFGATQVVPTAVLSGVFKLRNLEDAQARGLTLFWAHSLNELTAWIEQTR